MNDYLENPISKDTRGLLYICKFDYKHKVLDVQYAIPFTDVFTALQNYVNIPNPESQLVTGGTYEDFCTELKIVHKKITDKKWLNYLDDSL